MVMTVLLTNNARSTLLSGINALQTEIRLRAGGGNTFPTITATGQWFPITIEDSVGAIEIMRVIARSGDVFTVKRAQEGTTAKSFSANDVVELRLTVGAMQELVNDTHTNFGRIYMTPADGVDSKIGVPAGYYFNVRSPSDDSYVDEYQNVNGVAVATGKSYPSGALTQAMSEQIDRIGSLDYLSEQLDQIAVDKGWDASFVVDGDENQHNINNKTIRFFKSMNELLLSKPKNDGQTANLASYHEGGQKGGSDFICIQSSVLVENGITIFRSKVVGFEDYFWVRVNIGHITPEMAGAIGDKTYNCRDAFQKCFDVGGEIRLSENSSYLIYGDDMTTHVNTHFLRCTKPVSIRCGGKASVYFKHDLATGSPTSIIFEGEGVNLESLTMEGINWYGAETVGNPNKIQRAWGIGLRGVDNFNIKRCKFSTFQGHCPNITRRRYDNNGDWIQSANLNVANTQAAVNRLLSLCSKNGEISNIQIEHCGSTGLAMFGADGVVIDGVDADMTGSLYNHSVWTDDASSQTPLRDYAVNQNITVKNVRGGDVRLDGCASGVITENSVDLINIRSYDFDQQKNNFDSGSHTYNVNDHLNTPFLWMKFLRRGIKVFNNIVPNMLLRTIYVDAYKNTLISTADGHEFFNYDTNGILWGNGVTHYDEDGTRVDGVKNNITDNTYIVKHNNCIGVDYGDASPNTILNIIDNIVERVNPSHVFRPVRYASSTQRRDSWYETDHNNGQRLLKRYNHPVDVPHSLLTQGLGTNNLKTYTSVRSGQSNQPLFRFTTTVPVYAHVTIVGANGNVLRKKLSITSAGVLTVTELDTLTTWNSMFTIATLADGSYQVLANGFSDLSIDIQAVGGYGTTTFIMAESRAASA